MDVPQQVRCTRNIVAEDTSCSQTLQDQLLELLCQAMALMAVGHCFVHLYREAKCQSLPCLGFKQLVLIGNVLSGTSFESNHFAKEDVEENMSRHVLATWYKRSTLSKAVDHLHSGVVTSRGPREPTDQIGRDTMPLGVRYRCGRRLSGGVDMPPFRCFEEITKQNVALHGMSKVRTKIVAFDQGHDSNYSQMAVQLRLVVHGHNRRHEPSRYKNALAHCRQVEESTIIKSQVRVSELMLCRRASNRDLIDVTRTRVFWIRHCPHC